MKGVKRKHYQFLAHCLELHWDEDHVSEAVRAYYKTELKDQLMDTMEKISKYRKGWRLRVFERILKGKKPEKYLEQRGGAHV